MEGTQITGDEIEGQRTHDKEGASSDLVDFFTKNNIPNQLLSNLVNQFRSNRFINY